MINLTTRAHGASLAAGRCMRVALNAARLMALLAAAAIQGNALANTAVEIGAGSLDSERRNGLASFVSLDLEPVATGVHTITVSWDSDADLRFNLFEVGGTRITDVPIARSNPDVSQSTWSGALDGDSRYRIALWSRKGSGIAAYVASLQSTPATTVALGAGRLDSERVEGPNITTLDFEPLGNASHTISVSWNNDADLRFNVFNNSGERINTSTVRGPSPAVWVGPIDGSESHFIRVWSRPNSGVADYSATLRLTSPATPLEIATQPADVTVDEGDDAIFSVAASGAEPLSYQWFANNVRISGATDASLIVEATSPNDDGTLYTVVVTSGNASLESDGARLSVVRSTTGVATVQFSEGTLDSERRDGLPSIVTLNFTARADALHTITVSWDSIIAELRFSVFNANNERISDGVVRSDSSPAVWQGILAADENYYIRLWAPTDSGVANYIATLQAEGVQPVTPFEIAEGPRSVTVAEGQDAQFSVSATGDNALEYQWLVNGTVIPGATSDSLTVASVTTAQDENAYYVEVSRGNETLISDEAVLTVNEALVLGLYSEEADTSTWMLEGPSPILDFGKRENSAWGQVLLRIGDLLLVGGEFQGIKPTFNGRVTPRPFMAALDAVSGQPATGFQVPPEVDSVVRAFALSLDGSRLYVGGDFGLLALNPTTGELEFSVSMTDDNDPGRVFDIAVTDAHVYIGGEFTQVRNSARRHLARLSLTGQLDANWSPRVFSGFSTGRTSPIQAVTVSPSFDVIYVGGFFGRINSTKAAKTSLGRDISMFALSASDGSVLPERFSADVGTDDRVLGVRDIYVTPSYVIIGWGGPNALTFHDHDGTRVHQYAAESDIQRLDVLGNYLFVGHHGEFLGPRNDPIPPQAVITLVPKNFVAFKLHSIRLDHPSFPVEQFWRIDGTFGVFGIAVTEESLWISGQLSLVGSNGRRVDGLARFSAAN